MATIDDPGGPLVLTTDGLGGTVHSMTVLYRLKFSPVLACISKKKFGTQKIYFLNVGQAVVAN